MKKSFSLAIMSAITLSAAMAVLIGCDEEPKAAVELTAAAAPECKAAQSGTSPVRKRKGIPKEELRIRLPKALSCAPTPTPINEPNIAPLRPRGQKRPAIMLPKGAFNLAIGRSVASNESLPVIGDLEMVTDGVKSGADGSNVDIGFGKKWVRIDLAARAEIYGVSLWHYHSKARAYRDVIVEVADDEDFTQNVRIVFNSDHDNSYGKGIGEDMGYIETIEGKFIYCPGNTKGRYVRLHSQGNSDNDQNHYIEVEVYGIPIK